MLPTGTGKRRISLAGRELAAQGEEVELAVRVASAGLVDRVELAARVASVALAVQVAPAELAVQVAPAELAVRGVAPAELERGLVAVALELVPVAVVPERDHLEARRRTRLVTAAHRRGLVPVPKRVEDLAAAAAETTPDPVATEAGAAWAAAVTVVAVVTPQ
jgi:hypothetical protein